MLNGLIYKDIWISIARMHPQVAAKLSMVNKTFKNAISSDSILWQGLILKYFPYLKDHYRAAFDNNPKALFGHQCQLYRQKFPYIKLEEILSAVLGQINQQHLDCFTRMYLKTIAYANGHRDRFPMILYINAAAEIAAMSGDLVRMNEIWKKDHKTKIKLFVAAAANGQLHVMNALGNGSKFMYHAMHKCFIKACQNNINNVIEDYLKHICNTNLFKHTLANGLYYLILNKNWAMVLQVVHGMQSLNIPNANLGWNINIKTITSQQMIQSYFHRFPYDLISKKPQKKSNSNVSYELNVSHKNSMLKKDYISLHKPQETDIGRLATYLRFVLIDNETFQKCIETAQRANHLDLVLCLAGNIFSDNSFILMNLLKEHPSLMEHWMPRLIQTRDIALLKEMSKMIAQRVICSTYAENGLRHAIYLAAYGKNVEILNFLFTEFQHIFTEMIKKAVTSNDWFLLQAMASSCVQSAVASDWFIKNAPNLVAIALIQCNQPMLDFFQHEFKFAYPGAIQAYFANLISHSEKLSIIEKFLPWNLDIVEMAVRNSQHPIGSQLFDRIIHTSAICGHLTLIKLFENRHDFPLLVNRMLMNPLTCKVLNTTSLTYLMGFVSQNTFNHLCQQALARNDFPFVLYLIQSHTARISINIWEQASKKWPKDINEMTKALRNQYGSLLRLPSKSCKLFQHIKTHCHLALNQQIVKQGHLLERSDVKSLLIQAMKSRNLRAAKLIFMHCGDKIPLARFIWYMMHRREKNIPTPIFKMINTAFDDTNAVLTCPHTPALTHQWQNPGKQSRKSLCFKTNNVKRKRRCKIKR